MIIQNAVVTDFLLPRLPLTTLKRFLLFQNSLYHCPIKRVRLNSDMLLLLKIVLDYQLYRSCILNFNR